MKVICDTHIWYYMGAGSINVASINSDIELIATYVNIDELSRTPHLIKNVAIVRDAINAIFQNNSHVYFEPPLAYLKQLSDSNFQYDIIENIGDILEFTQSIANGDDIEHSKLGEFEELIKYKTNNLKIAANLCNEEALKIQRTKKNKKKHRALNSLPLTRELISQMVGLSTNSFGLPETFDWTKIELFENVLNQFFIELEVSKMKIKPNDWFDIFQLIYVQPNNKIWTREIRWIEIIKYAKMDKYLFELNSI